MLTKTKFYANAIEHQYEQFRCGHCKVREHCLPSWMPDSEEGRIATLIDTERKVRRGDYLYRSGDSVQDIFAVMSGYFKVSVMSEDGREQITGFYMAGEFIGYDGIGVGIRFCNAIALEDSVVCPISIDNLNTQSIRVSSLRRFVTETSGQQLARAHRMALLLGKLSAEERLAALLLDLSQRLQARGYSSTEFHLRMTREEIGSHLGLTFETVSRIFSQFQERGLIRVQKRYIQICDLVRLKMILGRAGQNVISVSADCDSASLQVRAG